LLLTRDPILTKSQTDWLCEIEGCTRAFTRHEYLRSHEIQDHGKPAQWRCYVGFCQRKFSIRTGLVLHFSLHHGEAHQEMIKYNNWQRPFKCQCDESFPTYHTMCTHYVEKHPSDGDFPKASIFRCGIPGCIYYCPSEERKIAHQKEHQLFKR
jgi:hypothetical protein